MKLKKSLKEGLGDENMGKLRGQMLIVGTVIFLILFLLTYSFLPVLGESANTAVANDTLFPRNGPTYLVAGLGPAIFILVPILAYIMFAAGGGQQRV